jgi:hypothetical protein
MRMCWVKVQEEEQESSVGRVRLAAVAVVQGGGGMGEVRCGGGERGYSFARCMPCLQEKSSSFHTLVCRRRQFSWCFAALTEP